MHKATGKTKLILGATAVIMAFWAVMLADWMWFFQFGGPLTEISEISLYHIAFVLGAPVALAWAVWCAWPQRQPPILSAIIWTAAYVVLWHFSIFFLDYFGLAGARVFFAQMGLGGLFLIGLCWVVWWVERCAQFYEAERAHERLQESSDADITQWKCVRDSLGNEVWVGRAASDPQYSLTRHGHDELSPDEGRIWNPLDPQCWLYGRQGKRLNQSVVALLTYTVLFFAAFLASTMIGGCSEIYELPAGSGQQQTIAQVIKVQKVIRKKFVVNPFSAIKYNVPPIEEIQLQLNEITKNLYNVGQGEGSGEAGFGAGTKRGAVRFIRIQYSGGDWDQDFGKGGDLNMLIEYGIRTKHKIAKLTESRTISQINNFKMGQSPPLVYLTGQGVISVSSSEIKDLREYLLDKHGMIFGDNGGSRQFHGQFVQMMAQVLPNVRPVAVPLDDLIHRAPYALPFLPYVVPHGGREALGWRVDGRWVCYYHPGDIGDAWADGHAGIEKHITEFCYQLGTNVMVYANAEYSKWVQSKDLKE